MVVTAAASSSRRRSRYRASRNVTPSEAQIAPCSMSAMSATRRRMVFARGDRSNVSEARKTAIRSRKRNLVRVSNRATRSSSDVWVCSEAAARRLAVTPISIRRLGTATRTNAAAINQSRRGFPYNVLSKKSMLRILDSLLALRHGAPVCGAHDTDTSHRRKIAASARTPVRRRP